MTNEIRWLPLMQIVLGPHPLRRFDPGPQSTLLLPESSSDGILTPHAIRCRTMLDEMVESIRNNNQIEGGLIHPITVFSLENDQFQLVTGEVRYRAMTQLNRESGGTAYAQILSRIVTNSHAAISQMIENLHRSELTSIERARGYRHIWDELATEGLTDRPSSAPPNRPIPRGRPTKNVTLAAVARRTGSSVSTISRHLRLLELEPDAQQIIDDFDLTESTLRYMLEKLPSDPYNPIITKLLRQATTDIPVWNEKHFHYEVDCLLDDEPEPTMQLGTDPLYKQRVTIKRLTTAFHGLDDLFHQINLNTVTLQRYANTLDDEADVNAFNRLIEAVQQLDQKFTDLRALSPVGTLRNVSRPH